MSSFEDTNESRSHGNNLYIGNISRARHRKIKSESKIDKKALEMLPMYKLFP
jgi:hypothetical protein